MIPRPKLTWIERDSRHVDVCQSIVRSTEDFFPIYHERKDNLLGVVSVKDCYAQLAAGLEIEFRHLMQPPLLAPEVQPASLLLDTFRKTGSRVAFVVNEFGDVSGMVTLTDLMEAVVGDVPSKEEWRVRPVQARDDGSYLLDGTIALEELRKHLAGFTPPVETEETPRTLAGMFSHRLTRIPVEGDAWDHGGWRFEIVDMDGIRVDKVLATPLAATGKPV
jgi:putative hemolysin